MLNADPNGLAFFYPHPNPLPSIGRNGMILSHGDEAMPSSLPVFNVMLIPLFGRPKRASLQIAF